MDPQRKKRGNKSQAFADQHGKVNSPQEKF